MTIHTVGRISTDIATWFANNVWLIIHQPTVLFSQNKAATSHQPAVIFSENKPAPTTTD
jgi:hypothetical protein